MRRRALVKNVHGIELGENRSRRGDAAKNTGARADRRDQDSCSSSDASRRRIFRNGKANTPIPSWRNSSRSIEENINSMVEPVPDAKPPPQPAPMRPQPVEPPRPLYTNQEQPATKSHTKWVALGVVALVAILAGFFFYREHAKRVELEQTIAREKAEQAERERIAKEEAAREAASRKAEDDRRAAERGAQLKAAQEQAERAARAKAAQQQAERVTPPGVYPAR